MKKLFNVLVLLLVLPIASMSIADNITHTSTSSHLKHEKHNKDFHKSDSKHFGHNHKDSHKKQDINNIFKHILKASSKLKLTESQIEEIKKISFDFQKDYIKVESDIKILKIELEEAFTIEPFNYKDAEAYTQDISTLISKANNLKAYALIDTLKLLTPKQRKSVNQKHNFEFSYVEYLW